MGVLYGITGPFGPIGPDPCFYGLCGPFIGTDSSISPQESVHLSGPDKKSGTLLPQKTPITVHPKTLRNESRLDEVAEPLRGVGVKFIVVIQSLSFSFTRCASLGLLSHFYHSSSFQY